MPIVGEQYYGEMRQLGQQQFQFAMALKKLIEEERRFKERQQLLEKELDFKIKSWQAEYDFKLAEAKRDAQQWREQFEETKRYNKAMIGRIEALTQEVKTLLPYKENAMALTNELQALRNTAEGLKLENLPTQLEQQNKLNELAIKTAQERLREMIELFPDEKSKAKAEAILAKANAELAKIRNKYADQQEKAKTDIMTFQRRREELATRFDEATQRYRIEQERAKTEEAEARAGAARTEWRTRMKFYEKAGEGLEAISPSEAARAAFGVPQPAVPEVKDIGTQDLEFFDRGTKELLQENFRFSVPVLGVEVRTEADIDKAEKSFGNYIGQRLGRAKTLLSVLGVSQATVITAQNFGTVLRQVLSDIEANPEKFVQAAGGQERFQSTFTELKQMQQEIVAARNRLQLSRRIFSRVEAFTRRTLSSAFEEARMLGVPNPREYALAVAKRRAGRALSVFHRIFDTPEMQEHLFSFLQNPTRLNVSWEKINRKISRVVDDDATRRLLGDFFTSLVTNE